MTDADREAFVRDAADKRAAYDASRRKYYRDVVEPMIAAQRERK